MQQAFTPRRLYMLHLRTSPGGESLRAAIARALALPDDEVRALDDEVNPVVRFETHEHVKGFRTTLNLYIDMARDPVTTVEVLAQALARECESDVAYHRGPAPFTYLVACTSGARYIADESADDDDDGLSLDEAPERIRTLV